jgi:hypothetical protein
MAGLKRLFRSGGIALDMGHQMGNPGVRETTYRTVRLYSRLEAEKGARLEYEGRQESGELVKKTANELTKAVEFKVTRRPPYGVVTLL